MTKDEFIEKAHKVHGNKYDYSKVVYTNNKTKVCIICPEHGEFWQTPHQHLRGQGCPTCGIESRSRKNTNTIETFNQKAKEIHGNRYDYSKVIYTHSKTKVCIICPKHGEFWQTPSDHFRGKGCPLCANETHSDKQRYDNKVFISKAKLIHDDTYDYTKVNYIDCNTKVCIICPKHGEFWQNPASHLHGQGCPQCSKTKRIDKLRYNTDEFLQKSKEKHENKYDYSKVKYINNVTNVCIICPEHGEFWQRPNNHLNGHGCPKCANELNGKRNRYKFEDFVRKAQIIHGNKYDYSKVRYIDNKTKVCIICPEHGEFWQRPGDHINLKQGCPKCNSSHIETELRKLLNENSLVFEEQKRFEWLGLQSLDFYLPEHNIVIEGQGIQHFEPSTYFGGYESWLRCKERDERKRQLCEEHGIKILYYANYVYDFPYEVITDKEKLLECIINTKNLED